MPGSAICTTGPHSPWAERPPSAGACSMASTVKAIAGRTKNRGLNSIIGCSRRSLIVTTNGQAPDRQAGWKNLKRGAAFHNILKSLLFLLDKLAVPVARAEIDVDAFDL